MRAELAIKSEEFIPLLLLGQLIAETGDSQRVLEASLSKSPKADNPGSTSSQMNLPRPRRHNRLGPPLGKWQWMSQP